MPMRTSDKRFEKTVTPTAASLHSMEGEAPEEHGVSGTSNSAVKNSWRIEEVRKIFALMREEYEESKKLLPHRRYKELKRIIEMLTAEPITQKLRYLSTVESDLRYTQARHRAPMRSRGSASSAGTRSIPFTSSLSSSLNATQISSASSCGANFESNDSIFSYFNSNRSSSGNILGSLDAASSPSCQWWRDKLNNGQHIFSNSIADMKNSFLDIFHSGPRSPVQASTARTRRSHIDVLSGAKRRCCPTRGYPLGNASSKEDLLLTVLTQHNLPARTPASTTCQHNLPAQPASTTCQHNLPAQTCRHNLPAQPAGTTCQHNLPAQPASTTCRHNLPAQPAGTTCQHNLPAQPASTTCRHNLPAQPAGTTCQHNLPAQPASTTCQHNLPAQPAGTTCQHNLPAPSWCYVKPVRPRACTVPTARYPDTEPAPDISNLTGLVSAHLQPGYLQSYRACVFSPGSPYPAAFRPQFLSFIVSAEAGVDSSFTSRGLVL
ncbi:hypothetical protein EGW08_007255 [Elysia chlorotica]|uniref:Uncharacterized protein n=1 Tax=Elysia chlorotica TaxID=188477 RepID=A0A3S0ZWX3_ELYCH|nr:hypothetical protein EGW08_007255 [Elysia chlorotica]